MPPIRQAAHGLAGCILVPRRRGNGAPSRTAGVPLAVTVSLVRAEPCLSWLAGLRPMSLEEVRALGCRLVRSYDDAVMAGLA